MIGLFTPNYNTGSSRFCGPTAIMAVTGEPGSVVRDAIRQSRGDIRSRSGAHMPVMGVNNDDLLAAMRLLELEPLSRRCDKCSSSCCADIRCSASK